MTCVSVPLGPACVNITGVRAGDRNTFRLTLTTSGGQPVDLTGLTLEAQARKKASDPDPPALTATITVIDAVAGRVEVGWPGDDVRTLMNGSVKWSGVWDLQADDVTLVAGTIAAEMDVTR